MKTIKIIFLLSIFMFVGCLGMEPQDIEYCKVTADCSSDKDACYDGKCRRDYCKSNDPNCGKGKCIPGSLDDEKDYQYDYGDVYYCQCEENAVIIPDRAICVPTCDGYSEECTEFGKTTDFDSCNMEKGHCDRKCQGERSCKPGYYCDGGHCEVNSCSEAFNCGVGYHCVDGLCEID
jgi:hypothetical protein